MFGIAPAEGVIILAIFALVGVQAFGIVDAAQRSAEAWRAAGRSKSAWILLQLFFMPLGSLVYLLLIRPQIRADERYVSR